MLSVYRELPDRIPVHFDFSGNADRIGSKGELLLLGTTALLLPLAAQLAAVFLKRRKQDEKQAARTASNIRVIQSLALWTTIFYTAVTLLILAAAFSGTDHLVERLPLAGILCVMEGVWMMVLGNYLPKTHRNGMVGLRCSWTLYSDTAWTRSNRFCGKLFVCCGVLNALSALLPGMWSLYLAMVWIGIGVVVSLIYAYKVYKEEIHHASDKS